MTAAALFAAVVLAAAVAAAANLATALSAAGFLSRGGAFDLRADTRNRPADPGRRRALAGTDTVFPQVIGGRGATRPSAATRRR
ncbi:Hypothetical protein MIP_03864 [Mycobacterium intracellulare subsp. intracellulare MTCC 9506]|uniref:Secreted protein n=1 Tax=Mycobacterium indicus pranii (strain DSM 45239 / MTCC 9506) TaxID=1232724 RepID=J9WBP5_MYCIP|nr:Hypothetical protein MIP_03864 [Mycobacterium intracellulare subsp. intracellulare MTCC 9506]